MLIMKTLLALVTLFVSLSATTVAFADAPMGTGTWEGSGTAVQRDGKKLGAFDVTITRKEAGERRVRADGTIKLANGQEIHFWQEFEGTKEGFHIVSDRGNGGGRCFDNGMCQTYEEAKDGHAFATSLTKDEGGQLRLVTTELDHGKAVKFFYQTLRKTN